jgi:hypothetical protein
MALLPDTYFSVYKPEKQLEGKKKRTDVQDSPTSDYSM